MSTEGAHAAAAAAQLFNVLGEAVVHWPGGVEADAETITAIVDRTEQVSEFAPLETPDARTIPVTAVLTLSPDVAVTFAERTNRVSVFVFGGHNWYADRPLGNEQGLQVVRVIRDEPIYTRRGRTP